MNFSDDLEPKDLSPGKKPSAVITKSDLLELGIEDPDRFGQIDKNRFEEDLMREFDQKASELSSFLDESNPISTSSADLQPLSASEKSSSDASPNPSAFNIEAHLLDSLQSGGSSEGGFDLMGDFKTAAGGDTKIAEELISAARDLGKESPTAADLGFEQVEPSLKHGEDLVLKGGDQVVPPVQHSSFSPNQHGIGHDIEFHYTQSEPVMHLNQGLTGLDFLQDAEQRSESPKLPSEPCFKPTGSEFHDFFSTEQITKSSSSAVDFQKSPSPTMEERFIGEHKDIINEEHNFEEYARRETMTFSSPTTTFTEEGHLHSQTPQIIDASPFDMDRDIPPPVPKHAYEFEQDIPPPVPKHADEFILKSETERPLHATYDDKIDDEFEDDSLSRPLSYKLSDSLEVLKESPQKDLHLDESLMDLDELPSSSKSISPNDTKNTLGDFLAGDTQLGGDSAIPREMMESTLFSQQPPINFDKEVEEKFEFSRAHEVDQSRPIASIPPFSSKGNQDYSTEEAFLTDSSMTSSMIMNTSLDEIQAPKFYESEDSLSKDVPCEIKEQAADVVGKILDHKEVDNLLQKDDHDSFFTANEFGKSSKSDVTEVVPGEEKVEKSKPVEKPRDVPPPVPKHRVVVDTDTEVSEEIRQILNILNPKAWFDPTKLHPTVGELVYWRDPKKSGVAFGSVFVVLIALTFLSLISVIAYTSLAVLTGTFAFRVYKSVLQAVQKTSEGHPFKEYLDLDITFSGEKAQELSNAIINYANSALLQLRRLFLVEDFVDSAKFAAFLYFLTYIGGWFNGLTLIILSLIAMFSLPKVYETNKTVIDQYIDLVLGKISEINAKVSAAVPFLKKEKAQ